jgi:hypothetical protein
MTDDDVPPQSEPPGNNTHDPLLRASQARAIERAFAEAARTLCEGSGDMSSMPLEQREARLNDLLDGALGTTQPTRRVRRWLASQARRGESAEHTPLVGPCSALSDSNLKGPLRCDSVELGIWRWGLANVAKSAIRKGARDHRSSALREALTEVAPVRPMLMRTFSAVRHVIFVVTLAVTLLGMLQLTGAWIQTFDFEVDQNLQRVVRWLTAVCTAVLTAWAVKEIKDHFDQGYLHDGVPGLRAVWEIPGRLVNHRWGVRAVGIVLGATLAVAVDGWTNFTGALSFILTEIERDHQIDVISKKFADRTATLTNDLRMATDQIRKSAQRDALRIVNDESGGRSPVGRTGCGPVCKAKRCLLLDTVGICAELANVKNTSLRSDLQRALDESTLVDELSLEHELAAILKPAVDKAGTLEASVQETTARFRNAWDVEGLTALVQEANNSVLPRLKDAAMSYQAPQEDLLKRYDDALGALEAVGMSHYGVVGSAARTQVEVAIVSVDTSPVEFPPPAFKGAGALLEFATEQGGHVGGLVAVIFCAVLAVLASYAEYALALGDRGVRWVVATEQDAARTLTEALNAAVEQAADATYTGWIDEGMWVPFIGFAPTRDDVSQAYRTVVERRFAEQFETARQRSWWTWDEEWFATALERLAPPMTEAARRANAKYRIVSELLTTTNGVHAVVDQVVANLTGLRALDASRRGIAGEVTRHGLADVRHAAARLWVQHLEDEWASLERLVSGGVDQMSDDNAYMLVTKVEALQQGLDLLIAREHPESSDRARDLKAVASRLFSKVKDDLAAKAHAAEVASARRQIRWVLDAIEATVPPTQDPTTWQEAEALTQRVQGQLRSLSDLDAAISGISSATPSVYEETIAALRERREQLRCFERRSETMGRVLKREEEAERTRGVSSIWKTAAAWYAERDRLSLAERSRQMVALLRSCGVFTVPLEITRLADDERRELRLAGTRLVARIQHAADQLGVPDREFQPLCYALVADLDQVVAA